RRRARAAGAGGGGGGWGGGGGGKGRGGPRRWRAEIRRNNTVLTFDIPGGGPAGRPFPLLMDVRNADRVAFKLYRLERPEDLLWVTGRIGEDFVYRDHGLQYPGRPRGPAEILEQALREKIRRATRAEQALPAPAFRREQLVRQWDVRVAELKVLTPARAGRGGRDRDDWEDEGDGWYFDDACEHFRARLDGRYRPRGGQPSSWQCGRIVEVPGAALAQAGAYVLLAEANGH